MINNVFYLHTKIPQGFEGYNCFDRATIACRVVDGRIQYGIAVCGSGDNFCREEGRDLAAKRMLQGYGELNRQKGIYKDIAEDESALNLFAVKFAESFAKKPRKYKDKIHRWKLMSNALATSE